VTHITDPTYGGVEHNENILLESYDPKLYYDYDDESKDDGTFSKKSIVPDS